MTLNRIVRIIPGGRPASTGVLARALQLRVYMKSYTEDSAAVKHVLAFARKAADTVVITAVPRLCAELLGGKLNIFGSREIWGDTRIELLPAVETRFENLFTGELIEPERHGNTETVPLTRLFANFPGALLISALSLRGLTLPKDIYEISSKQHREALRHPAMESGASAAGC